MQTPGRKVVWFSCGAASAVAAKLAIDAYGDACTVVYCDTLSSEHPDNARFFRDVEHWLGRKIEVIRSEKYRDIDDVFEKTRFMASPFGARCTTELKKLPARRSRTVAIRIFLGIQLRKNAAHWRLRSTIRP